MNARRFQGFVLYQDVWADWRWALYSPDSVKVAESGFGYRSKLAAVEAARRLAALAAASTPHFDEADARTWVV